MRLWMAMVGLLLTGCASMPDFEDSSGLPLGRSGWQLSGGADFDKKVWFVAFVKPFGQREKDMAQAWGK